MSGAGTADEIMAAAILRPSALWPRTPSVGSSIAFYKNGQPLGPAFTDVWAEVYYPAAALYKAAQLTFNFGPAFAFPPADAEGVAPMSSLAAPAEGGEEGADLGGAEDADGAMEDADAVDAPDE